LLAVQPDPSADEKILVGLPPNRIETLVDGIFAVAMTILVLERSAWSATRRCRCCCPAGSTST
jgi:hypothetical protein